ncbi:anti-sigma factor domain-containing protein [Agrococcus terreus]|uniref:Regulator of SigK n=1 Tax=Agrococcus terreus TaxID=574649 RepID=A0ABQ2KKV5_9MICO|nr:anti-sigma factor [Agrococcus terreus]GGN85378.1 hypothetical protein GCM10010968_17980 [Agrococcus terreus]
MSIDDQRAIDELAAAYALDALDADERALFEAKASPEARAEATALAETASRLSSDEATPSPFLRASVLDAIARTPQLPAEDATVTPLRPAPAPAPALDADDDEPIRAAGGGAAAPAPGPAERRAKARWRPLRTLVGVAAAAALLSGGIAIGTQLDGGDDRAEAVGAIVAATDAQRAEVEMADGSVATVVWSAEEGRSAILFDGLGSAPAGQVYQAWYIDAAGPHSAGTFTSAGGSTAYVLDGELTPGTAVGVTVEPDGGSEAPTTDPILVVET